MGLTKGHHRWCKVSLIRVSINFNFATATNCRQIKYNTRDARAILHASVRLTDLHFFVFQLTNSYLVYWLDETAYLDPEKEPKGCINLKRVGIFPHFFLLLFFVSCCSFMVSTRVVTNICPEHYHPRNQGFSIYL